MREEAEAAHWAELKRLRAARAAEVRQLKAEDAHAERIARMSVGCVRVPWDLRVRVFKLLRRQRHNSAESLRKARRARGRSRAITVLRSHLGALSQ